MWSKLLCGNSGTQNTEDLVVALDLFSRIYYMAVIFQYKLKLLLENSSIYDAF